MRIKTRFEKTTAPHWRSPRSSKFWMWHGVIALLPVLISSLALDFNNMSRVLAITVSFGFLCDFIFSKWFRQEFIPEDGNTLFYTILLSLFLPYTISTPAILIAVSFAVIFTKECFGGYSNILFHPSLAGVAFLFLLAPTQFMGNPDLGAKTYWILVLIGISYLIFQRVISWKIPFFFSGFSFIFLLIFGEQSFLEVVTPVVAITVCFAAAGFPISPMTTNGRVLYAFFLAFLFVYFVSQTENNLQPIVYATLIASVFTPLINRYLKT